MATTVLPPHNCQTRHLLQLLTNMMFARAFCQRALNLYLNVIVFQFIYINM